MTTGGRRPSRRYGAVDFSLPPPGRERIEFWDGIISDALKDAGMTHEDDFSLRLVAVEALPDDLPVRKS